MSNNCQSNIAKLHQQPLPSLPAELIFEILLMLPVKSLLEFKRVCKSWKTIISDPQFANNHVRNLTLNPSLTHQRLSCSETYDQTCKFVSFPLKPYDRTKFEPKFTIEPKFSIIGSCNGLLCLFDMDEGYVKLWNPSIGFKSRNFPTLNCFEKEKHIRYHGFGYDHVNDKYKVLLTVSRTRFYKFVIQIYTFGENCWRTIQIRNFPYYSTNETLGKFLSGTLNWVKPGYGSKHSVIISFDIEKETYKEVLLPERDGVKAYNHVLGVSSNCLCVCFQSNEPHFDFWLMKSYGVVESWTRLMTIPQRQFSLRRSWNLYYNDLFILGNGIVLLINIGSSFTSNINNGRLDLQFIRWDLGRDRHIYHESLVAPQC